MGMKRTDTSFLRHRRWMPLGLSLIGVGVLWLAGCQRSTPVADVTQTPPHTPTVTLLPSTATKRPSATPTPRPTFTATASPTATLPPAWSPATPPPGDRSAWRLVPWTAEQADRLIAQTASQLLALEDDPAFGGVYGGANLESMYGLLGMAEQEALLRFPEAPQADRWRWDLAYNQGIAYLYAASPYAPELATYAALLGDGLNAQGATLETLPDWFASHETRLALTVTLVEPMPPAKVSALVAIDGMAYFWVTRQATTYTVVGLESNLFYFREAGSWSKLVDLTGDGHAEIVLTFSTSHCCGFSTEHVIYDVSSGPPVLLTFVGPTLSFDILQSSSDSSIEPLSANPKDGEPGLIFDATYGDPYLDPCSIRRYDRYRWTGRAFVWTSTQHAVLPPDEYDDPVFCEDVRVLAPSGAEADVAAQAAGDYYEDNAQAVLPLRVRFRVAEYRARVGETMAAQAMLENLLAIPEGEEPKTEAPWREAARTLLDALRNDQPFLKICGQIAVCDWSAALTQWVGEQSTLRPDQLDANLKAAGVDLRASGPLALPPADAFTSWWVVRNPHTGQREFWIVAQIGDHFAARQAATLERDSAQVTVNRSGNAPDVYAVSDGQTSTLFQIRLDPVSGLLVTLYRSLDPLDPEPDRVRAAQLDVWSAALFAGQDPDVIREGLRALRAPLSCSTKDYCLPIDYAIGLASELLGDEQAAVEAYARAWEEEPDSLYAIWIRLKLGLVR